MSNSQKKTMMYVGFAKFKRLNSANIIQEMLAALPELQELFREYEQHDDISLLHNVFAFVFNPFLKSAIDSKDDTLLKRIFCFLERMAETDDRDIRNILSVTILESLSPAGLVTAQKYMGPRTKSDLKELEEYLERLFKS